MINITLLKVIHEGEEEAKKLLPHIEKCDVFSREAMNLTEAGARSIERQWPEVLKMSRSKFNRVNSERYVGVPPEFVPYNLKRDDYIFRAGKPVIFLERWSPEEARVADDAEIRWNAERLAYLEFLAEGNIEGYIILASESLRRFTKSYIIGRDKHIAANIDRVEQLVQQAYPHVDVANMKFTMELGVGHAPQEFTRRPINVVELNKWSSASEKAMYFLARQENLADHPREMLIHGLGELVHDGVLQVSDDLLMSASLEELRMIVKNKL